MKRSMLCGGLAGALAITALAGCGSTSHTIKRDFDSPPPLENTRWRLNEMAGRPYERSGFWDTPQIKLRSTTASFRADGTCNLATGSYQLDNSLLVFETESTGSSGCLPKQASVVEKKFFKTIEATRSWRIEGYSLKFFDSLGTTLTRFEPIADDEDEETEEILPDVMVTEEKEESESGKRTSDPVID